MSSYEIRVKGQLDPLLAIWFGEFTITHTAEGDSLLKGTITDQAALYGVVARCRDLGLTLISINPTYQKEIPMSQIHIEADATLNARPEEVYAVLSDYHVGHAAIIPRQYFPEMTVLKGGKGAGTELHLVTQVMGVQKIYRQIVTEPEPGHILMEADHEAGVITTFTVEPVNGGKQTHLTIKTDMPATPGVAGMIEKLMTPSIIRYIYRKELKQLADYLSRHVN